ncbi:MAG: alpha/beta hydrolase-fold protein [Planctomycetota bacterium]
MTGPSDARYRRDPSAFRGAVETRPFESEVLRGNALGDPHVREVPVYLPPAALDGERLPVAFLLAGFTGRGQSMLETHPWKRGAVQAYDAALAVSGDPGLILVMPDAFTRLGGSQYVNSSATGRYADHVADELVRFVDETYPTQPGRRAVCGKSSGGFGALHLAMQFPGVFRAAASISGDCAFELPLGHEMIGAARALLAHGGDPRGFLDAFEEKHSLDGDGHAAINVIAMSACYAPAPDTELGFKLPFDPATVERRADVWNRFLSFDLSSARRTTSTRSGHWIFSTSRPAARTSSAFSSARGSSYASSSASASRTSTSSTTAATSGSTGGTRRCCRGSSGR